MEAIKNFLRSYLLSTAFGFTLVVGYIDYSLGQELSFSIFYLIPISMVVWGSGIFYGVFMVLVSMIIWFISDLMASELSANVGILLRNQCIRFAFFAFLIILLEKFRTILEQEKQYSNTDQLTGLLSPKAFLERLDIEMRRLNRYKRPLSVAYMDADNFKKVNDTLGHSEGNKVLIMIGEVMRKTLRDVDLGTRIGGDEFVVAFPETNASGAQKGMARLERALLDGMQAHNWPVTFSIGVATFLGEVESVDYMIREADRVMYLSKNGGKNMIKQEVFGA